MSNFFHKNQDIALKEKFTQKWKSTEKWLTWR